MITNSNLPSSVGMRGMLIACCSVLLLPAGLRAQTNPIAAPPPPTASNPPPPSEVVQLDPFEVQAPPSKGYGELNSNSIAAFNTELNKMPVSADVFDQTFMNDTRSQTVEQMLQFYSAGAGMASSQPDTSAANSQYLDRNANGSLSLRGLQAPTVMLNGFFPAGGAGITGNGITVPFDLEKIEVINGPQALLYGVSGAGGVINETTKLAKLGSPSSGFVSFQVDQFGDKQGQIDIGMGSDKVAVRFAAIDQELGGPRVFYGGPMQGEYLQLAVRPISNTVIRVSVDNQVFNRINDNAGGLSLTSLSTANDARNGQTLNWLLATNQLQAAANGAASGGGPIPGLNWTTIDSLQGDLSGEFRHRENTLLNIDTTWNSWLSSQIGVGYTGTTDFKIGNSQITYDAPNVAANPTGAYAVVFGTSADESLWEPSRQKVARASLLATNDLFGGKVHSQTIAGVDATRTDGGIIGEYYVAADGNYNPIYNTTGTANSYEVMPTEYWAVPNGPIKYPLGFNPMNPTINYLGQNYVRAVTNGTNPALVSPGNPEGLTGNGVGDFRHTSDIESGIYAANFSDWFNGDLTTLGGFRIGKVYDRSDVEASAPNPPSILSETQAKFVAFTSGVTFKITNQLRGYAEFSDNYDPPGVGSTDPYGNPMKIAHGLGEEVGLKETFIPWNLSGQLAIYHASSTNETLAFTSTIARDINPSGVNGIYNAGSNEINVNRETEGVQLTVTAAPGNWRFRLSAATIKSTIENGDSYAQLYNDQFYTNLAGDVTYADGTVVYVAPTYSSKTVAATPAASAPAGYVPLTLATINTPTSSYYANPAPVSSVIPSTATALLAVLNSKDPTHGAIKTGVTGLPISDLQIAPNATSPPIGNIVITEPGDSVSGFPRFAMNFIGIYTIPSGLLQGLELGGSTSIAWKTSMYYYYTNGVTQISTSPRVMLYEPTEALFNGIFGWSHKFGRFTFLTQLNVNNMFNHYHLLLLPSSFNGWSGPNNATLDQEQRNYVWSSTIEF